MVILLQQHSTDFSAACVYFQFEWFVEVWGCQNRGTAQQTLKNFKCKLTLMTPRKRNIALKEICQQFCNIREVFAEAPIIASHPKKTPEFTLCFRLWKGLNDLNFSIQWPNCTLTNYAT